MSNVKIVEYNKSYAAGVAEMWNHSHEGWGGSDVVLTPEQVEKNEANSENINVYLAVEGDKVVGYCSLSNYAYDDNTMYIPLLNVRTDQHGKKIGKKLLLKVIERVVELNQPRLDLFTWPGNTKAVPLYKKAGFFWEDRNDTTHLMNFVPALMNTEALKKYFTTLDWYDDNCRKADIIPDGRKENNFEYYRYSWKNSETYLNVEFDGRGRCIRLIDTPEYKITTTVENLNLVFGAKYEVSYHIVNKTDKPLEISIHGENDKNVEFGLSTNVSVNSEHTIKSNFKVNPIQEEQSIWKTHPLVAANFTINGKKAKLGVGIAPQFPIKMRAKLPGDQCHLEQKHCFYIDLENKFEEEVELTFSLDKKDFITFPNKDFSFFLKPKERKSIKVPYILTKFGFYNSQIEAIVKRKNGKTINFHLPLSLAFKGYSSIFHGEDQDNWVLCNGSHYVHIEKLDGWRNMKELEYNEVSFMPPQLGKPYCDEFTRLRPSEVHFSKNDGVGTLKLTYNSKKFSDMEVAVYNNLHANGLLENYFEVTNNSLERAKEDVWLRTPVFTDFSACIIPYDNKFIHLQDSSAISFDYWKSAKVSENWLFGYEKDGNCGVSWSKDFTLDFTDWFISLSKNLGKIPAQSSVKTKSIFLSVNTFDNWSKFRNFSIGKNEPIQQLTAPLKVEVNGGNPFVPKNFDVTFVEQRTNYLSGEFTVTSKKNGFDKSSKTIDISSKCHKHNIDISLNSAKDIDIVQCQNSTKARTTNWERLIIPKNDGKVETSVSSNSTVSNGKLSFSISSEYGPYLYSLEFLGQNFLDSSYPKAKPKSWFNPWYGGITFITSKLRSSCLEKEEAPNLSTTKLSDNMGNFWTGIKVSTKLKAHEELKGLVINQHYLTMGGLPIVCQLNSIEQKTGHYFDKNLITQGFLKMNNLSDCFMQYDNIQGQNLYQKGAAFDLHDNCFSSLIFGNKNFDYKLQIVSDISNDNKLNIHLNQDVMIFSLVSSSSLADGDKLTLPPVFYIFTNERLSEDSLVELKKVRF
ncbi:GNAT family N-acetyltransferase [Proteinivorax tanatarense]|uniref:GNAT family N-acetyltransferase n=1 Tax=Proteinivorax tanatarense TaxID=1260629 RepID=A0AAU7VN55_9FIRM